MPIRPPAPGAFNHTSRIDQRTIHIEQNRSASQSQRIESTSPGAYFLPFVAKDQTERLGPGGLLMFIRLSSRKESFRSPCDLRRRIRSGFQNFLPGDRSLGSRGGYRRAKPTALVLNFVKYEDFS